MSSQGPNYPNTANITSTTEVGTVDFTSLANASADDGVFSTRNNPGGPPKISHYVNCQNYGFSVPSGATINGVLVEAKIGTNSASNTCIIDNSIKLVKGGVISGNEKARSASTFWTSAGVAYASYGGSSDLWGLALTDTDVNASNFGVGISCKWTTSASQTARIDAVRITVYYTTGTVYTADMSVTATWTPSTNQSVSTTLSVTNTVTPVLSRSAAHTMSITSTITPVLAKVASRTMSVVATRTPSVVITWLKTLSIALTETPSLNLVGQKLLSVVNTITATLAKAASKPLAITITQTPLLAKSAAHEMSVTNTITGSLTRSGQKVLTVGNTITPSLGKAGAKTLSVAVTQHGSLNAALSKPLAVSYTETPVLEKQGAKALNVSWTSMPSILRTPVKSLAVGIMRTASLVVHRFRLYTGLLRRTSVREGNIKRTVVVEQLERKTVRE